MKNKNIDKYIKLSDMLIYTFHHRDKVLSGLNTPLDTDPDFAIMNEVKKMLLNIQEDVDHDDVAKVLIENEKHDTLIEMLQYDTFGFGSLSKQASVKELQNQEADENAESFGKKGKKQIDYEKSLQTTFTAYNKE